MWTTRLNQIDGHTTAVAVSDASGALSYGEAIDLWRENAGFRTWFAMTLKQSTFEAFFWETPPVTSQTLGRPFEFVLVESSALARSKPDPSPFQSQFAARGGDEVLTFPNLGGDAILVVPAPVAEAGCYTHLAQFLRHAPESQVDTLWHRTGQAMHDRVTNRPTWLSTAGLGVSWLHLRLDTRPKYYRHAPFKANPSGGPQPLA